MILTDKQLHSDKQLHYLVMECDRCYIQIAVSGDTRKLAAIKAVNAGWRLVGKEQRCGACVRLPKKRAKFKLAKGKK